VKSWQTGKLSGKTIMLNRLPLSGPIKLNGSIKAEFLAHRRDNPALLVVQKIAQPYTDPGSWTGGDLAELMH